MVRRQYQDESLGALQQFMSEVKRAPPLDIEEEGALLLALKSEPNAVQARDRLIGGYQPLLIGLAKRFARNCKQLELLDPYKRKSVKYFFVSCMKLRLCCLRRCF